MPNPDRATSKQIAAERIRVASYAACTERKRADLVRWIRETLLGDKPSP